MSVIIGRQVDSGQQPSTNKRVRMMVPQATAPGITAAAVPCTAAADYQVFTVCCFVTG